MKWTVCKGTILHLLGYTGPGTSWVNDMNVVYSRLSLMQQYQYNQIRDIASKFNIGKFIYGKFNVSSMSVVYLTW